VGVDFIRSQRQSRKKGWSYQLARAEQDMLSVIAPTTRQSFRVKLDGELPRIGHSVVLQLTDKREVMVRDKTTCIGLVTNPPEEVVAKLAKHSGLASATVEARLTTSSKVDLVIED
jgi:hypothetical protein